MPDVSQHPITNHSISEHSNSNSSIANRSTPKPFVIEIRQDRPKPNGSFIPLSSLKLNEEFRTCGLLAFLSPEDLKNLLYLLTFVTPEGHCQVSLPILTSAMKVPSAKVKARMHRLAGVKWQGESLVIEVPHASGLFTYSLHPQLVAYEHLTVSEPFSTPPLRSTPKSQIITYSREHYARPREEVERLVAAQMGHDVEETGEQRKLRTRLENVGLTTDQAREVVHTHPADVIAQQLDWLPYRNAKNPARYLLAAIEGGYQEPRAIRERRFVLEEKYGGEAAPDEMKLNEMTPHEATLHGVTATAIKPVGEIPGEIEKREPEARVIQSPQSLNQFEVGQEISLSPDSVVPDLIVPDSLPSKE